MRYHLRHFPNIMQQLQAERLGLEPRGRFRDHSLAGCCITTLPPFQGVANLDRKSVCAIVFGQIIGTPLLIYLWVRYSNVINSPHKALESVAYCIYFFHGNRCVIKLTRSELMTDYLVYHFRQIFLCLIL